MHRCGAETATTERPCGMRVPAYGVRCPRHRDKPLATVVSLDAYRQRKAAATLPRRIAR